MKTLPKNLPVTQVSAAEYSEEIAALKTLLCEWEDKYQRLLEQFKLSQHTRFGKSSEAHPEQGQLFNEAEAILESEPESVIPSYTRKKSKGRPKLPANLPREYVTHDLPDADKVCDCCGHPLHRVGQETCEKLDFIPAQIKVIAHIRPKYSCRACEHQDTQVTFKIMPPVVSLIPRSISTPTLLAQIITQKYQYGLPLYRQESLLKQLGIELSRKTMSSWMLKVARALERLYQLMIKTLLSQSVINADETPLKVIHSDKAKCYMWVYCCGTDGPTVNNHTSTSNPPNIVIYDYQSGRGAEHPINFLQGYHQYLQVDGYQAYGLTDAVLVACMAHARRKFTDAEKVLGKGKAGKVQWALSLFQKLYRIEKEIKGKPAAEIYRIRQERAKPLLTVYKDWLDKSINQVPPKSTLGKAIAYSLNQWPKLVRYLDDGRLNIDNNRAERAIKSFVIGRKNWLFLNTVKGANASAVLYSFVETAKANGFIPFDYLTKIFNELPKLDDEAELDHLLPWNIVLK